MFTGPVVSFSIVLNRSCKHDIVYDSCRLTNFTSGLGHFHSLMKSSSRSQTLCSCQVSLASFWLTWQYLWYWTLYRDYSTPCFCNLHVRTGIAYVFTYDIVHVHSHMHTHTCTHTHTRTHMHTHTHTHAHTHTRTRKRTYIHSVTHTHMHVCTYTHTHTHTHAHTHTHTLSYMPTLILWSWVFMPVSHFL